MAKIVLLVPAFPKLSETFILNKFLGLLKRGWDVHLVCWQSQPQEWKFVEGTMDQATIHRRVHVVWPQRPRGLALLLLPFALVRCLLIAPQSMLRYLMRGWRRFGPDVFRRLYLDAELVLLQPDMIHFEFGALSPERMYLKELLGCKVLVSFRGYDLNFAGLDQPEYYRPVWEHADALHLLGRDLWARAQRRGCPADKAHVLIPPAIDTDFFVCPDRVEDAEAGTAALPLRILSVGRLEWKKGYEYALQAIRLLRERGVNCVYRIVGEGEYYEALMFARHQLGLEDCVEFMGALTRDAVREQLAWADVFLHAAVSEGFCNAVLEAQAMQLPIVCSDAGGLRENVVNGVTGFIVPRRDPFALAEKILLLTSDAHLRRRMGHAGRAHVSQHFHVDRQCQQFDSLYRSVLQP